MTEVSASVLTVEPDNATSVFYNLETSKINYYHIDVMDGKFVKKNTKKIMKDYALTISHISNLGLDVHFMVDEVDEFIEDYANLEPEIMTFHIETTKTEEKTNEIIKKIKDAGSRVGIALSPDTSIDTVIPYLDKVHMVLVMTVVPGLGGQKLIPETLEKVRKIKEYIDANNIDIDIEVDGGINDQTSKLAVEAGANILVSGNYIIASEDYKKAVDSLK